jgi:hypothetical protein
MSDWLVKLFPDWEAWASFWSTLEFGRESSGWWIAGFALLVLSATWLYRRDTRALNPLWKVWLWGLRIGVLLVLLVIALAPQERRSEVKVLPSQVVILADTSASMSRRDKDDADRVRVPQSQRVVPSRADLVRELFEKSPLLNELRKTHDVHIETFDSQLVRHQLLRKFAAPNPIAGARGNATPGTGNVARVSAASQKGAVAKPIGWAEILRPRGVETRLGEALLSVIREQAGETLAGVVVVTDGGNNAGVDPLSAAEAALANKVRLIPVGVGSTKRPVTLQLAEIQAPTHVHINDGFTITAFVTSQGLARQPLSIELSTRAEQDEGEPAVIQSREEQLLEDGVPISVAFDYTPTEAGRRMFRIRVRPIKNGPGSKVAELDEEEVQAEVSVEVIDRKTRVLLVAGGPMRDYQLVRNLVHRDRTIDVDVLLQTGVPGISQESDNVIFQFPETKEELFAYDVIVAFDPDWKKIRGETGQSFELLSDWVFSQAGGLMLVAGEVNTTALATASDAVRQDMAKLLELYPVVLDSQRSIDDEEFQQAWPIEFTREGLEAGFLQLTENAATSAAAWKEFPGIYRCFPTDGPKAAATVYARFTDPRSTTRDQPILLASQYFGAGRVLYLGSAELWRLRSLEEEYYDRLWIKMLREVGQGRLLRGTNRGILLLEKTQYPLGATVQVRARLLDPQFKEYQAERVVCEVFDPNGRPLTPAPVLLADKTRTGNFGGAFVAALPGTYKLELPIPESTDLLQGSVSIRLPNLEFDHPEQNEPLLRSLALKETGGVYLKLDEAASQLPSLLPDRMTEKIRYDFPRTLWDREWVMYLLVGLLSAEWLTRKLLKLA